MPAPVSTTASSSPDPRRGFNAPRWLIPLSLALLSNVFSAWLALGSDPDRARWLGGIDALLLTHRLQGLLPALAVLPALALLGLVLVRFTSVSWVATLLPGMLLLSLHVSRPSPPAVLVLALSELPRDREGLPTDEPVLGCIVSERPVAIPLRTLMANPLVVLSDAGQRALLMWNEPAGSATLCPVALEVKAADLEVVGNVDQALLVHNRRFSQFIVGLTGLAPDGSTPIGLQPLRAVQPATWGEWKRRHPSSHLVPVAVDRPVPSSPADAVSVVHGPVVVAVPPSVLNAEPLRNTEMEGASVLLVRDDAGTMRCFDRRLENDLFLRFRWQVDPRSGRGVLFDPGTNSTWSLDGVGLDGETRGRRLREYVIEPAVSWSALRRWRPEVPLIDLP